MARNKKPKQKKNKEKHPTIFVLEGTILFYEEGSMLDLHTQIQIEEWEEMVEETVKYKVFLECLKSVGMPLLEERWEEEDDYFRLQLDISVSRMRNIDPILVASHNQETLTEDYVKRMKSGAIQVGEVITQVREAQKKAILDRLDNGDDEEEDVVVSDL